MEGRGLHSSLPASQATHTSNDGIKLEAMLASFNIELATHLAQESERLKEDLVEVGNAVSPSPHMRKQNRARRASHESSSGWCWPSQHEKN